MSNKQEIRDVGDLAGLDQHVREAGAAALEQGWRVRRTNNNHIQFLPADPQHRPIHTGGTSSDWRAAKNMISALRRAGLDI